MPRRLLPAALTAVLLLLTGCSGADWSVPHDGPLAEGALADGFLEPGHTPTPEATVLPEPGSWDAITPVPGYRVVLLTRGDDPATSTLAEAVRDWARDEQVDLRTVEPETPADLVPGIAEAVGMGADLIVSVGDDLVDPLAVVSPNHLDQQFLVVGAEIAEPTANVTAVDWTGAAYRGEGLGAASDHDPATFTPERSARAIRAGVGAVLGGLTGIVVWID
ncbi:hypothetical protein [Cellulomonas denverensis]|uniref:hypothetical protein n=1 Tax=Cellulomonas denverensis TaxID=264297 RepID=UPI001A536AB8|nr:hypothetical protein [Cellulomonas denverensis]GIG27393.1 hypothetical protein Cde04nite_36370 [Cellulomonas denverensis]